LSSTAASCASGPGETCMRYPPGNLVGEPASRPHDSSFPDHGRAPDHCRTLYRTLQGHGWSSHAARRRRVSRCWPTTPDMPTPMAQKPSSRSVSSDSACPSAEGWQRRAKARQRSKRCSGGPGGHGDGHRSRGRRHRGREPVQPGWFPLDLRCGGDLLQRAVMTPSGRPLDSCGKAMGCGGSPPPPCLRLQRVDAARGLGLREVRVEFLPRLLA
jgi:hypothetical protein